MVHSLRKWGGRLADAPVMAIAPRRNAPLAPDTHAQLRDLNVEHVRDLTQNPYPWFNFANKVAAFSIAENRAATPGVLWLDSDVIVAGEPSSCFLPPEIHIAGRGEPLAPATRDPGDQFEPYWLAVCKLLGVDFHSLPYLDLTPPDRPIRTYLNAGVFAWRRGTGFIQAWRSDFIKLMQSRLSLPNGDFFFNEQTCLGLTAHRLGLKLRHLPQRDHHMIFQGQLTGPGASPPLTNANLIHYSHSSSAPHWPAFLERLRAERPEIHAWLAPQGPIQNHLSPLQRAFYLPYKITRSARLKLEMKRAIPVVA